MKDDLGNEKLKLEIEILKIKVDKLTKKDPSEKKITINLAILIPLMTAIIGAIVTISMGLYNSFKEIEQSKLQRETEIIKRAVEVGTIEEKEEALLFYQSSGLIKIDSLKEKIAKGAIVVPGNVAKLDSNYIWNSRKILLIDNHERYYGSKEKKNEGNSNADDIWKALRKNKALRTSIVSLVIDKDWDEKNEELSKAVKNLNPKLIVMHLSSFCFNDSPVCPNDKYLIDTRLIPFLSSILESNDSVKILLYSRKTGNDIESLLGQFLLDYESRVKFVSIRFGEKYSRSFEKRNQDKINLLEQRILRMIEL